jgi:argininosuccinate lyase
MPGYTHMQAAMPSSFGLWFGAFAEALIDDVIQFKAARKIADQNPLGSAAGYGSSVPVNRSMTTALLGFQEMSINVIHAQLGRGKVEQAMGFAIAAIAATLNKLSSDVCLFNSQNFGFLKLPDELTTGSSIMPHKKDPDVFELIRAKTNKLKALPNELALVSTNLPTGYHRDFQLLKESLFPAIEELKQILSITDFAVSKMEVREDILDDPRYKYIYSVEVVNRLVQEGTPFRDAYREVARQIKEGDFEVPETIEHTHEGSIGNLMNEEIRQKFNRAMGG